MRLLLISSEAVPYSKTGGLADVSTALAKALASAGHDVSLILPHHVEVQEKNKRPPLSLDGPAFPVRMGDRTVQARSGWDVLKAPGPAGEPREVRVLFVDQADYFDRPGLYGDPVGDYEDNAERFIFFSRAALELARLLALRPHCIHANDWQTGLVPAMLEDDYRGTPGFESTGSVFTIHNLAFQGSFPHWDMRRTGLDWDRFHYTQLEHHGRLNLLKAGIAAADKVTTVSPTYANEIRTEALGYGLEGALIARGSDLSGVLNGVDPAEWSPENDPYLAANYTAENVAEGKAACKAALRQELKLKTPAAGEPDPPLFGMISRMTDQKGFDLIAGCAEELIATGAQFAFLGTGDPRYEGFVRHLSNEYSGQVAGVVGFDNGLAHRIEAGCDAYLMPSLYEPCGLNQMYSLAYGTVPVVHAVGGLADTVVDATPDNLANGSANGFVFTQPTPPDLWEAVSRAAECYRDAPADWAKLVQNGMAADHSWDASAAEYLQLYQAAAARHDGA
ncbi:glycogen synthase GlgA [Alienimonas chondri]|uniref:Glycogen synthase n=1 Tax=Alienimonas chondri TaxID=2681879 RepID=A0ABX1VAG2_9PLAN|nr:glycogen synthase GlgA [Alienimonas chondri]NNJ24911.1 Glycogen synthase [Alienimonas chondri]